MKACFLIHGFLTNYHDFDNIISDLEQIYDNVYKFIVPGHTDEPNYKLFNVEDTFNNMLNEFDKLKEEYDDIDCIGFSMGGALACYLQSVRQINKLVLLAPANKYINFDLLKNRIKYKTTNFSEMKKYKHEDEMLYNLIKNKLKELKIDDKQALNIGFNDLFPNYNYHNISTFMNIINKCNKELFSIDCDTLIIWGKLDQLVPYSSIEFVSNLVINNKKVIILDDISHLMLRSENKNEIIKYIIDFLRS